MRHPDVIAMLGELIALPSVSSVDPAWDMPNRAVIDRLAEWAEARGFRVEVLPLDEAGTKANLIATRGHGEGGLVLAGHTDTVPCDEALWQSDPFTLNERLGRLHGLGTTDMKGFLPLALAAADGIADRELQAPLIFLATADEESSMAGARALARMGRPRARAAVIGEPTNLRPVRAHKGVMMEAARVIGRSGHSSNPALGCNALEGMHQIIGALLAWRDELAAAPRNDAFAVPHTTINLGSIRGGDNPNRICGACELTFDIRPLPGLSLEDLRTAYRSRLERTLADQALQIECRALIDGVPALETPASAAIVRTAEGLTGDAAETAAFGTEAPFLSGLGMETLVWGPGDIACAHQPDEYLLRDRLEPTIDVLQALIRRFCGPGSDTV